MRQAWISIRRARAQIDADDRPMPGDRQRLAQRFVKTARLRSAMPLTSIQSRHGDLIRRIFNAETIPGLDERMLTRGRVEWLVSHRRSSMQAQSYRSPRTTQAR